MTQCSNCGGFCKKSGCERANADDFTPEELSLCRQWFDFLRDTNAEYFEPSDYLLAEKIYKQLNMRVPNSISEITKSGIGGGR